MANNFEYVTAEMLERFKDKKVSLIGYVTSVASNSQSFEVRAVDDVVVKVNLKRPLTHPLSGYVMVRGTSQGKTMNCETLDMFSNEEFDTKGHNTLCSLLQTIPNVYASSENN